MTAARERVGEAFELDEQLTVVGDRLVPGQVAPAYALASLDADSGTMQSVTLADSAGTVRLLNVINSLDTPVCHVETRRWDTIRESLPDGVTVQTISMDLPFAQARWVGENGVNHRALSSHRDEAFGIAYGVLLKEWRLLQRAVFVIDADDVITHVEYVPDQMQEPSYDAAVEAVKAARGV